MIKLVKWCLAGKIIGCFSSNDRFDRLSLPPTRKMSSLSKNGCNCNRRCFTFDAFFSFTAVISSPNVSLCTTRTQNLVADFNSMTESGPVGQDFFRAYKRNLFNQAVDRTRQRSSENRSKNSNFVTLMWLDNFILFPLIWICQLLIDPTMAIDPLASTATEDPTTIMMLN